MNTLGKTVVSVAICVVIILAIVFTRDFGAPKGKHGDGFGTEIEAIEDGIGNSYSVDEIIGSVDFDDAVICLCKTKDQKLATCFLLKNRQQTKYYLSDEPCHITELKTLSDVEWCSDKNKVKTNFLVTDAENLITNCDNRSVDYEEYEVVLNGTKKAIRLYYNRISE